MRPAESRLGHNLSDSLIQLRDRRTELSGAMKQCVVVEPLPDDIHLKDQGVIPHLLVPVMLHLNAAPAESNLVQRLIERNAALSQRDVNMIPHGFQLTPKSAVVYGKSVAMFASW